MASTRHTTSTPSLLETWWCHWSHAIHAMWHHVTHVATLYIFVCCFNIFQCFPTKNWGEYVEGLQSPLAGTRKIALASISWNLWPKQICTVVVCCGWVDTGYIWILLMLTVQTTDPMKWYEMIWNDMKWYEMIWNDMKCVLNDSVKDCEKDCTKRDTVLRRVLGLGCPILSLPSCDVHLQILMLVSLTLARSRVKTFAMAVFSGRHPWRYHYYIKLVPTIYVNRWGTKTYTNQYSVTDSCLLKILTDWDWDYDLTNIMATIHCSASFQWRVWP